jgi:hypothetical protein
MNLNVAKELADLRRMTVGQLRDRYAAVLGQPTNARHKDWLVKRIIWRLQSQAEGDLSERARQRAAELANDADLRVTAPKVSTEPSTPQLTKTASIRMPTTGRLPLPGTLITRVYKGRELHVQVLDDGFEFEGAVFKSLSAVAKHITGSHCNGYLFFRLGGAA